MLTSHLYDTVDIGPAHRDAGFHWQVNRAVLGSVGIAAGWIPQGGYIASPANGDRYVLSLARVGSIAAVCAGTSVAITPGRAGMLISPELPFRNDISSGFASLTLTVDRTLLEAHFCKLTQAPLLQPLRFLPFVDLSTGPGAGLLRLIEFVVKELEHPDGLLAAPLARASLNEALLTALLTCAQHDQSHQLAAAGPLIRPGYVRRAEAYIDAHAGDPITMVDVAVAGVSLRALQKAFVRYRGSSPKDFLKERRLDLVRSRLLAAEPNTTVISASTGAGYSNCGRFASDYKRRFGEAPSETRSNLQPVSGLPPGKRGLARMRIADPECDEFFTRLDCRLVTFTAVSLYVVC